MILVDSSVWIDFFNGADSPERHLLHDLIVGEKDLASSGIIITEILQGIRSDKEFKSIKEYCLQFPIYNPNNLETYLEAAQIFRSIRKKGKTIRKTLDCIIAAICIENNLELLHKDKDFTLISQCTKLKVLHAN
jgi:predicted nucleic acid-binding protein